MEMPSRKLRKEDGRRRYFLPFPSWPPPLDAYYHIFGIILFVHFNIKKLAQFFFSVQLFVKTDIYTLSHRARDLVLVLLVLEKLINTLAGISCLWLDNANEMNGWFCNFTILQCLLLGLLILTREYFSCRIATIIGRWCKSILGPMSRQWWHYRFLSLSLWQCFRGWPRFV